MQVVINKCFLLNPEKNQSDYFIRKKVFYKEKEHCAIFIHAHFMWGLQLRLGLS